MAVEAFTGTLDAPKIEAFTGTLDTPVVEEFTGKLDAPPAKSGILDQIETGRQQFNETMTSLPGVAATGLVSSVANAMEGLDFASTRVDPDQAETYAMYPESPAAQAHAAKVAEFERSKEFTTAKTAEAKAALPTPTGNKAWDTTSEVLTGVAGNALPIAGTLAAGIINPALGLTLGLGQNALLEAGGQYREAQDKGAGDDDTLRSMGFGGAVSTMLETSPLGVAMKLLKKGAPKPTLADVKKIAFKEAGQEGATQLAMDSEANLAGWGKYGLGEMASRTAMASAQGAIMGAGMGAAGVGIQHARDIKLDKVREAAVVDVLHDAMIQSGQLPPGGTEDSRALIARVVKDVRANLPDPGIAKIHDAQNQGEADMLPDNEYGTRLAAGLDGIFGKHRTGKTLEEEVQDYGGVSAQVDANRTRRTLEGLTGSDVPSSERRVAASSTAEEVGLRFRQLGPRAPGSVTVISGSLQSEEALFPQGTAEGLMEAGQRFAKLTGIDKPIIIQLEQLEGGQQGAYERVYMDPNNLEDYVHVINPRELPSFRAEYSGGNQNAQIDFLHTFSHEFGHLLRTEKLGQGIAGKAAQAGVTPAANQALWTGIERGIKSFSVTPEQLNQLRQYAPIEADLVAMWKDTAERAMNPDSNMTGRELVDIWLGPRKFAKSMNSRVGQRNVYAWIEEEARKIGINKTLENMSPAEVVRAIHQVPDANGVMQPDFAYVLKFDEYMAEQFSRAAHDRNYLKGTRLGKWFQSALDSLRSLFAEMKNQRFVKPDATFERWLDEQTATAAKLKRPRNWGKSKLTKEMKALQKKILAEEQAATAELREGGELATNYEETGEVPPMMMDEVAAEPQDQTAETQQMIDDLLLDELIEEGKKDHKTLLSLVNRQKWDDFYNKVSELRGVAWDRNNVTSKLISRLPEKETLKRVTVESLGKQLDLKKQDVLAVQAVLAAYPEGNIPRAAVVQAILDQNVPLEIVDSYAYSDNGLEDAGILPGYNEREMAGDTFRPISHIFKAPFLVNSFNHFENDPNYVAHTRILDNGSIRLLTEIQSDLFQKLSMEELAEKLRGIQKELIEKERSAVFAVGNVANAQGWLDQMIALPAGSFNRMPRIRSAQETLDARTKGKERIDLRLKEAQILERGILQKLSGEWWSAEHENLLNSVQRDDWWQRVIREEIANAANSGMSEFRVVDADTLARIENWAKTWSQIPADSLAALNAVAAMSPTMPLRFNGQVYKVRPGSPTSWFYQYNQIDADGKKGPLEMRTLDNMPEEVQALMHQNKYPARDFTHREAIGVAPLNYGPQQGIYDRQAKVIPKWLAKEYGAVHVKMPAYGQYSDMPQRDNGAWAFSIPEAAKDVLMWDMGNPANPTNPEITADYLAGLTLEEARDPGLVSRAIESWAVQKFQSPWFKRWWKDGKLFDVNTGEPLVVYHGSGNILEYFDITLARNERAFFFSDSAKENVYGTKIWRDTTFFKNEADSRKATAMRQKIEFLGEMLDKLARSEAVFSPSGIEIKPDAYKVRVAYNQTKAALLKLQDTAETLPSKGVVSGYYVRMENPYYADFEGAEWVHGAYDEIIRAARENGHDGIVIKNALDPQPMTVYMVFNPEQIKDAYRQKGPFEESDRVQWDLTNSVQSSAKHLVDSLKKIDSTTTAGHALKNTLARGSDLFVQLQQRAAIPLPNGNLDLAMQKMVRDLTAGEAYKNTLQQPGEILTRELQSRSPEEQDRIYAALEAEWKGGVNWFQLEGWSAPPGGERVQVWGNLEDGSVEFSAEVGMQVAHWEYGMTQKGKEALANHGIDIDTVQGGELGQLILMYKGTILQQFGALENTLNKLIVSRPGLTSVQMSIQTAELYQTIQKIRNTPFFPQGHYGNYTIVVEKRKKDRKKGERKYETVRIEYYESQAEMETALTKWNKRVAGSHGELRASWQKAADYEGIPLTLPRNLLESLEKTNLFTPDQLTTMSAMMLPIGHEKLTQRYQDKNDPMPGGERDLVRNYANFIWHNANFIWKMEFRGEFTKAINAHGSALRAAQRDTTPEGIELAKKLQRNHDIMNRTKEYVLHPPYELQGIRTAATLVYLAYNAKTSIMNFGTMLNTYAAITAEYGEVEGNKLFGQGLASTAHFYGMRKDPKTAHIRSDYVTAENSELAWMYNRAVTEGMIDQSYAYFLAGQANSPTVLTNVTKGPIKNFGRIAAETGMYPFRMVEKANRLATLTIFFEAERKRGSGMNEAYEAAVQRMNLLQNAYNAGNKSELFRGKKAIFFMFASYSQFMVWNMTGGYSQFLAADLSARGLAPAASVGGAAAYNVKMWFIYIMLGGMLAPPFMDDLMEIMAFFYRKMFQRNLRLDVRKFVKDMGRDPDLITHGMLSNVAGMDLSASFSLGRIIPGISMLGKPPETFGDFVGAMGVKAAGAFGGFTEHMWEFMGSLWELAHGRARVGETLGKLPGAAGAIGKAYDAYVLQKLQATHGVLNKSGARVVEDPPGSGKFRDLTNWEMVTMALNANPSVLSHSREMNFMELSEQIYWRTRSQTLLDTRWKAISTRDKEMLEIADSNIQKFNKNLPKGYEAFRVTGKMKADSLRNHQKRVRDMEQGRVQKRLRGIQADVATGFAGREDSNP